MVRRVFFAFHYERDIWRANQVRNCWVTKDREEAGFFDASLWEEAKIRGDEAIKRIIREGLENTSVTAVLIGAETSTRPYVDYEITESYNRPNGLLGIYINNLEDRNQRTDPRGVNPFSKFHIMKDGRTTYLSEIYPVYDWKLNDGYNNFATWVEAAARAAGR